jgi:hypothetical protein
MSIFNVTYTAYEKGSSVVLSEGTMPINSSSMWTAQETVKAMFMGTNLIIRYTTNG